MQCKICGALSSKVAWVLRKAQPIGNVCKACHAAKCRTYYHSNKEYAARVKASTCNQRLTTARRLLDCKAAKNWASLNKDKVQEYTKLYGAAWAAKRRANKRQRIPNWLSKEDYLQIKSMYTFAKIMTACTGKLYHVDHILPLKGKTVSGLHTLYNLQILPALENIQKGNKYE